jgi:hypothetical protein
MSLWWTFLISSSSSTTILGLALSMVLKRLHHRYRSQRPYFSELFDFFVSRIRHSITMYPLALASWCLFFIPPSSAMVKSYVTNSSNFGATKNFFIVGTVFHHQKNEGGHPSVITLSFRSQKSLLQEDSLNHLSKILFYIYIIDKGHFYDFGAPSSFLNISSYFKGTKVN